MIIEYGDKKYVFKCYEDSDVVVVFMLVLVVFSEGCMLFVELFFD